MKKHFLKITLNFSAIVLLLALIVTPLYFAKNAAKVAGVKSQSQYLVISQIDKFPNMKLTQSADNFTISFNKLGPSQLFQDIMIINNPTNSSQKYSLNVISANIEVFFGNDLTDRQIRIIIPSQTSVPISLSSKEDSSQTQEAVFRLTVEDE